MIHHYTRHRLGMPANQLLRMLPGLTGDVARGFRSFDPAITISTSLMSMSMLAQGIADALWPNTKPCPLGCSSILIAPTVSGKSVVYDTLADHIRNCVKERLEAEPEALKKTPAFFVQDATREAVIMHLMDWPIAALSTDEGAQVESLLRGSAAAIVKLVDGSAFYHARVSTGRAALEGHRFLIHAMMQPDIFEECKAVLGVGKGSVGLINRCAVAVATSSPNLEAMDTFGLDPAVEVRYAPLVKARINRAIDLVLKRGNRSLLRLNAAADRRFKDIAREAVSIQHHPDFAHVIEYTSRHCERVLHAAGTLHVVEHDAEGEIQLESVEAAHQIGLWSLDNYSDLMAPRPKPTRVEVDAALLERRLIDTAHYRGQHLALAPLRRLSANIGLTPARFSRALPVLADAGKITLYVRGRDDMIFVHLPPAPWLDFNRRF
jgi:DNA-binding transcriptional ArsR family regulator